MKFGTDGVRGRAFDELSEQLAFALGFAAADVLGPGALVIGRDTRESGPALATAVATGAARAGSEVVDIGVAPTPAVAHVAASRGFGAMISASHNPWHDNGIKFFSAGGHKLSDQQQHEIEQRLGAAGLYAAPVEPVAEHQPLLVGEWVQSVTGSIHGDLAGLHVVIDGANGAAAHLAAPALVDLGAQVSALSIAPDGRNINDDCGSTHPANLQAAVQHAQADVGVAFDGDADRLVCVDDRGQVVDGDQLMAIIATDLAAQGKLRNRTVVVTVMSNLGFHRAMAKRGIDVAVTPVGDRHILEALSVNEWSFGGEQSGHLIFRDLSTTGDGLLSALQVLEIVRRSGRPLSELADEAMTRFPQVLRNIRVAEKVANPAELIAAEVAAVEQRLGDDGRVLIRASGTEPVIRVMVEAATAEAAETSCDELCQVVQHRFVN